MVLAHNDLFWPPQRPETAQNMEYFGTKRGSKGGPDEGPETQFSKVDPWHFKRHS